MRRRGRNKPRYTTQEALARFAFTIYRSRARKRKIRFSLSREEFYALVKLPCHYCGSPPQNKIRRPRVYGRAVFRYQGIDRKDNARGYTTDNVVPCCGRCNWLKSDILSYEEMLIVGSALTNWRASQSLRPPPDQKQLAQARLILLLTTLQRRGESPPESS